MAANVQVAKTKEDWSSVKFHEAEINKIVYRLFDLTEAEIALIESTLGIETASPQNIVSFTSEVLSLPAASVSRPPQPGVAVASLLKQFVQRYGADAQLGLLARVIECLASPDVHLTPQATTISAADHEAWRASLQTDSFEGAFGLISQLEEGEDLHVCRETLQITIPDNSTLITTGLESNPWIDYDLALVSEFLEAQDELAALLNTPETDEQKAEILELFSMAS